MNTIILEQYGINFQIIKIDREKEPITNQIQISNLSYHLCGFLDTQIYKEYLEEEIIIEIDKAIGGLPFDSDGGGDGVYLNIGFPNSTFTSGGGTSQVISSIPTEDLKEIILSWIEFLNNI